MTSNGGPRLGRFLPKPAQVGPRPAAMYSQRGSRHIVGHEYLKVCNTGGLRRDAPNGER